MDAIRFQADLAAHASNRFADDRQPHPGPIILTLRMRALKQVEQALLATGVRPNGRTSCLRTSVHKEIEMSVFGMFRLNRYHLKAQVDLGLKEPREPMNRL